MSTISSRFTDIATPKRIGEQYVWKEVKKVQIVNVGGVEPQGWSCVVPCTLPCGKACVGSKVVFAIVFAGGYAKMSARVPL